MIQVELFVQVCINGRPIWVKKGAMKKELTLQMTDKEYGQVVNAAIRELSVQVDQHRAKTVKKEPAAK